MTQNDAVETAVILKLSEHVEAKAFRIHLGDRGQVIGRPDYPHRRARLHSDARLTSKTQFENLKPSSPSENIVVIGGLEKALRVRATWCRRDKRTR